MIPPPADHAALAARLRAELDELAGALAGGDLPRLLECQARLEAAAAHIALHPLSAPPGDELGAHAQTARDALARCRRLGAALDDVVEIALAAQGLTHGYGRGPASAAGAAMRTIHRTV